MNKRLTIILLLLHIPDAFIVIYFLTTLIIYFIGDKQTFEISSILIYTLPAFFIIKSILLIYGYKIYYKKRLNLISNIITNFKKGQFAKIKSTISGKDELSKITKELSVIGKYFDDTVLTFKNEIENFRELYNNIVLTISSYLIILNEQDEIFFINDAFSKKFQVDLDEIIAKKLDEVFIFFSNHKVLDAIKIVKNHAEPVVLEKTHILSKSKTSIIADIKISSMLVQGQRQIVMIIDDITHRYQKDYQINLMSQVTGSMQQDQEIHRLLYAILYGITSGAGIGFNRAMLFLLNKKKNALIGEMAVGPDSMDEAVEIWNSLPSEGVDNINIIESFNDPDRKGKKFLEKVTNTKYEIDDQNIITEAYKNLDIIHIFEANMDERVGPEMMEFLDVNEFVIVPLILENRAIGIVIADNKFNQLPIGDDHIKLLTIFAGQAALLIESHTNVSSLKNEMGRMSKRQEAIVESEKLAAIGRIAAHIAHEIRNPLVTMGGYATRIQLLMKENGANKDIQRAAEIILKETERLEKFLFNVMDLTKPPELVKKLNDINKVIKDTVELLKNLFQERKIRIFEKFDPDLPLFNSDFNQMKQTILNLLQNAIDATPSDGTIELSTKCNSKNIIISLRDNGSGIADSDIEKIFDPFFTTKVTGVGLGLSIVHKIIKDHNGEINVKNRETGGAEFIIKLPVSK